MSLKTLNLTDALVEMSEFTINVFVYMTDLQKLAYSYDLNKLTLN